MAQQQIAPGARLRLGGLVEPGSVAKSGASVRFAVTDGNSKVTVAYTGLLPDLFREGQGVVAEGVLQSDGTVKADSVLAKHDERYMPREVADALKKSGHWKEGEEGGPVPPAAKTPGPQSSAAPPAASPAGAPHDRGTRPLRARPRARPVAVQMVVPAWGAAKQDPVLMGVAGPVALALLLFVSAAFAALVAVYVTSDFSVANVVENSHSQMPLVYKITSTWGNHEGSMMLWVLVLAVFGALVAVFGANLPDRLKANALAVQGAIATAFLAFILLTSNPFLRILQPPAEGRSLNPVLQDPGLAIHPPLLYLGYVGLSIAFSFAMAALIEGRIDAAWARWVRPWTLAAWVFLTLGIAMGSYWAYYELGWGGWWFWDPVENASLMPWLAPPHCFTRP